eukprot:scaffold2946_cov278-Chaetoceros_neogracile.AAC.7
MISTKTSFLNAGTFLYETCIISIRAECCPWRGKLPRSLSNGLLWRKVEDGPTIMRTTGIAPLKMNHKIKSIIKVVLKDGVMNPCLKRQNLAPTIYEPGLTLMQQKLKNGQ